MPSNIIFFSNLTQAGTISEAGVSVEELSLLEWAQGKTAGHFLDWWQVWEEARVLWVVPILVPGFYKKADWAGHEEEVLHGLCFSPCSGLPLWWTSACKCKQNAPFSLQVALLSSYLSSGKQSPHEESAVLCGCQYHSSAVDFCLHLRLRVKGMTCSLLL